MASPLEVYEKRLQSYLKDIGEILETIDSLGQDMMERVDSRGGIADVDEVEELAYKAWGFVKTLGNALDKCEI